MRLALLLALLLLVGCGGKEELGMKTDIQVHTAASAPPEKGLLEHSAGDFEFAIVGTAEQQGLVDLLATTLPEALPAGRMVFSKIVLTNRRGEHPTRASVIIEAELHWQPTDGSARGGTVSIKTHSIPLDYPDTQIPWLRENACKGMWKRLLKAL